MTWTTHRYSLTKCHVSERGPMVLVVFATMTRPAWQWAVVRRSRWLDIERNPWRLDGVAEHIGGAGSWQQARRYAMKKH